MSTADRKYYCISARYHSGDEKGDSAVRFARITLPQAAKDAGFSDAWLEYARQVTQKESNSDVQCASSPAEVFTERAHSGDENGSTTYTIYKVAAEKIAADGSSLRCEGVLTEREQVTKKESKSGWVEVAGKVIVGRSHKGDENADTTTTFAKICLKDGDNLYELGLTDITETNTRSENQSDFYMDETVPDPEWMGRLGDQIKLRQLVLPASHDAGMSELHHMSVFTPEAAVKTQDANIYQQLLYGSRYFDIRVDYDHERLVTYHRTGKFGGNGQFLKDVFDQARNFLRHYPSETFIMKISHIRYDSKDTADKIKSFLEGYKDFLYCSAGSKRLHELTLGELRGKMLVVCQWTDFVPDIGKGLFSYTDADDGPSQAADNALNIYDHYANTDDYNTMKNDQTKKWQNNTDDPAGKLFLLSWTLTQGTGSIEQGAAEANAHLEGVLDEKIIRAGWLAPFLVYMDFVSARLCSIVIRYNFL